MTLKNGTVLTASNLDKIPKILPVDLYVFKYLSKPAQLAITELRKLFEILNINPALLNNPYDREEGVKKLLKAAQDWSNAAVLADRKLQEDFSLWGEPLATAQRVQAMMYACTVVKNEFSNYNAKYNTPAKLNNFNLSAEQIEKLGQKINMVNTIKEYINFKTECSEIVTYISNIEYLDLGAALKNEIETAKADFRSIRDDIAEGLSGETAARKIKGKLETIKGKYIDFYFAEHKKKHLDINEARRRNKLLESLTLANLKKLKGIEILSGAKLTAIEQDISDLGAQVCYELTVTELRESKESPVCPHCRYTIANKLKNVAGVLDSLEARIEDLSEEWKNMLLNTISDPLVESQKEYLDSGQKAVVDKFISTGKLPDRVDDYFVNSIKTLLRGFEPVIIDIDDIIVKLDEFGPCDVTTFKSKFSSIVDGYIKGKDQSKLRIVLKRKD